MMPSTLHAFLWQDGTRTVAHGVWNERRLNPGSRTVLHAHAAVLHHKVLYLNFQVTIATTMLYKFTRKERDSVDEG
jgi:hypothetical protein